VRLCQLDKCINPGREKYNANEPWSNPRLVSLLLGDLALRQCLPELLYARVGHFCVAQAKRGEVFEWCEVLQPRVRHLAMSQTARWESPLILAETWRELAIRGRTERLGEGDGPAARVGFREH